MNLSFATVIIMKNKNVHLDCCILEAYTTIQNNQFKKANFKKATCPNHHSKKVEDCFLFERCIPSSLSGKGSCFIHPRIRIYRLKNSFVLLIIF